MSLKASLLRNLLVKALRNGLGYIIIFFDWVSRPRPVSASLEERAKAQDSMNGLSLYQLYACPFCVKTRRALHRLGVSLETKDIGKEQTYRSELEAGGGRVKVPCLKIQEGNEVRWLYESKDIISFLEQRTAIG